MDLEPNFALANYNIGLSYIMMNNPDAAIAAYHKALELAPGNILFESHLWYARAIKGDTVRAKDFKRQLVERWESSRNFSPYFIAIVSAGLNETEEVLKYLELAIDTHDAFVMVLPTL